MKPFTVSMALQAKRDGKKITMLTAYDYLLTKLLDKAGIDILLVGDSLSNVIQGNTTTIPVSMDEMIYHTRIVARTAKRALVVGDMPFMSYQISPEDALYNAGRFMKEGGCAAIKLEGGREVVPQIRKMVQAGIPVMGHIGLTPQAVNIIGFRVQGKTEQAVQKLISDAVALEDAGCFAIVLEGIPTEAARRITNHVHIPTIGIGAGPHCDGQVLVTYDMLGFTEFNAKFVKRYALIKDIIKDAAEKYISEVEEEKFPTAEFSYNLEIEEIEESEEEKYEVKYGDADVFDDLF
ncbi:MAG: 3-methyl-2-oxobutanoate hydroxymethyltransferase [Candidatus Kariarchaeaceae archaeon]|jgi:3-methyl-2-oxobutanoate hydroxymethyltransferase